MRIETITLRELRMRLKAPFETSSEVTWERRILLVEVGVDGLHGWGEITAAEDPFYNAETTDTAWHITRDFIVPFILGKNVENGCCSIWDLLDPIWWTRDGEGRSRERGLGHRSAAKWFAISKVAGWNSRTDPLRCSSDPVGDRNTVGEDRM